MKDEYHLTLTVDEDYYSHRIKKKQTIELSIDGYIFKSVTVGKLLKVLKRNFKI